MKKNQRRILELYDTLNTQGQSQLQSYAEYLCAQPENRDIEKESTQQPKFISAPESESVIAAIRRLSNSYFMLERSTLLNTTSIFMAQHVMQGRSAIDVIKDLEINFATEYTKYCEVRNGETEDRESTESTTKVAKIKEARDNNKEE